MARRAGFFWGLVLVFLGGLFFLGNMGFIDFTLGRLVAVYWPLALVYIGARMVARTYGRRAGSTLIQPSDTEPARLAPGETRLFARHVLGDLTVKVDGPIEGGILQVGLGNLEVDLRQSGITSGSRTLQCITRVGQVRVRPPEHAEYRVELFCLAGDVVGKEETKDGVAKSLTYTSPGYHAAQDRLLIRARSGIGSVYVR